MPNAGHGHKHIATVLLQDYFHRAVFSQVVSRRHWDRFETRFERDIDDVLELLSRCGARATFFTLGWVAERYPRTVRRIAQAGHEIADSGYWVHRVASMPDHELRTELSRSKALLESVCGERVWGFRAPLGWLPPSDTCRLQILMDCGYAYDASIRPRSMTLLRRHASRFARCIAIDDRQIHEIPPSSARFLWYNGVLFGGNYLRQFPHSLMLKRFRRHLTQDLGPFVLYFHPWEMDTGQPMVSAIGSIDRLRQYRNLGKLKETLPDYFSQAEFTSVRDFLGLPQESIEAHRPISKAETPIQVKSREPEKAPVPVSVIIPCYNEEATLPYLEKALGELSEAARGKYRIQYTLVDDCSTDSTPDRLRKRFGTRPDFTVLFHEKNKGVSGAILTGLLYSPVEIACSMDADCSYDPLELLRMIPLLEEGISMVTASPYHRDGAVLGVPGWRLFLSRGLSKTYHVFLRHKFATYTSCFRVYRRSAIPIRDIRHTDFLGIVELIARLDSQGATLREFPTTLQSRLFGYSKMKTLRTISRHLGLLAEMYKNSRLTNNSRPVSVGPVDDR